MGGRVEFRVDGALREVEVPSAEECSELISRAEQLSDPDLAEARLPRQGRMGLGPRISLAQRRIGAREAFRCSE